MKRCQLKKNFENIVAAFLAIGRKKCYSPNQSSKPLSPGAFKPRLPMGSPSLFPVWPAAWIFGRRNWSSSSGKQAFPSG